MRSLPHPVDAGLDTLAGVAAGLTGRPTGEIAAQTRGLLGERPASMPRSGLNNDGFPAQLSVTIGPSGCSSRLLVDPGACQPDLAARYDTGLAAVRRAMELGLALPLLPACLRAIDALVPSDQAARAAYVDGYVWVATSLGGPGSALFVDCTRDATATWARLLAWLGSALPDSGPARELVGRIRGGSRLMCAGVEGVDPRLARLKVYWRLAEPGPLTAASEDFADQDLRQFVASCLAGRPVQLDGLVLCVGWSAATGASSGVKADLCGHCLARPGPAWRDTVASLAAGLIGAVPPSALLAALADEIVDVAYLGFGADRRGGKRLNVYLRPSRYLSGAKRAEGA